MQIIETIALISINGTLMIQLGSFLLFLFLINRIMIRPLHRVILERQSLVERIGHDIVSARERYEDVGRQMKAQEEQARSTAFAIREEIEASGKKTAKALMAQTRREIDTIRQQAQQETAESIAKARETLHTEAISIADRMVDTLLNRRIGF